MADIADYRPAMSPDQPIVVDADMVIIKGHGRLMAAQALGLKTVPVVVASATLVVAAVFSPLRRRVQGAVDRRFNRARYDADQMGTAFAVRLKDTVDLDSVQDDLASVVRNAPNSVPLPCARYSSPSRW